MVRQEEAGHSAIRKDQAMSSTFPEYQYAMAGQYPDPTQWSNPYSNFQGAPLPFPPGYAGTPSNAATGQPIQPPPSASPQGTTLNSMPAQSAATNPFANVQIPQGQNTAVAQPYGGLNAQQWNALTPQQRGPAQAAMGEYQMGVAMTPSGNNFTSSGNNPSGNNPAAMAGAAWQGRGAQDWNQMLSGAGQQIQPSVQPASQAGSYQNALNLLGNPGTPQMSGAAYTPQQAMAGGGQGQNILNNFIQNWQQGGIGKTAAPGIGGGSSGISFGANNPFFSALGATK